MDENGRHWFVIHTYSGHEERVKKNLEQRMKLMDSGDEIFQVVVPTEITLLLASLALFISSATSLEIVKYSLCILCLLISSSFTGLKVA